MTLCPTLDHVVVNVHQRMDEAADTFRRLGFTLTPRGTHSLGSINHLAMFGTDYLELIGLPPDATGRQDLLTWPLGLNGLVWGTEDAGETQRELTAAGVHCHPWGEFTRPVDLPGGSRDAVFRTVRLANEATTAGRLYFCQHLTRDLVWRDEWRHHANGTVGVSAAIIAARDPARLGGLFARMFGTSAVASIEGGMRLAVGLTRFDVLHPDAVTARFGTAVTVPDDRPETMAALVLRTTSLAAARSAIQVPGVRAACNSLIVPPRETFGVTLAFET